MQQQPPIPQEHSDLADFYAQQEHADSQLAQQNSPFPPPIPSNNAQSAEPRQFRFKFSGNASEYFKIWISNLFLTIITLSFYAPWAKVRRLQYFYGNTSLNNTGFSFTALPQRILIGRLIAMGLFILISILGNFSPEYSLLGFLFGLLLFPWLIRSTLRFRARNSKFGNVRFAFTASVGGSFWAFFCMALLSLFTLGLAYPYVFLLYKRYQINNLQIGQRQFKLNATVGDFYGAILKPYAFSFVGMAMLVVIMSALMDDSGQMTTALGIVFMLIYILAIVIQPLIQGYLFKATWDNVTFGQNKMSSDINPFKFAWIQLTNYIAILISFGLLFAWAKIRLYRYTMESLTVHMADNPEDLRNTRQNDENSIAEEISDVFDIDISL